jgi:hypothetical protein
MGFDFLMVSDLDGNPLAGVLRNGSPVLPVAASHHGLLMLGATVTLDTGASGHTPLTLE